MKKLNFMKIKKNILSRSEMKNIMAGNSGSGDCRYNSNCTSKCEVCDIWDNCSCATGSCCYA